MLGNAFDHFEDLADIHRLAVEGLDVAARGADLARQFAHGDDGLLHHLTAIFGQMAGIGGLVRGLRRVAGDLLGGSAQLIDGGGHAVGAVGLFVGVGHR